MTDETERAGLGKVIYSVNEKSGAQAAAEDRGECEEVEEAVEESFPASDPPSFATGSERDTT